MSTWYQLCEKNSYPSVEYYSTLTVILSFTKSHYPGVEPLMKSILKNTKRRVFFIIQHDNSLESFQVEAMKSWASDVSLIKTRTKAHPYAHWLGVLRNAEVQSSFNILYIDVDIIVNCSIDAWIHKFNSEFPDALVSGVNQKNTEDRWEERNHKHLINTGVVLFKRKFFYSKTWSHMKKEVTPEGIVNIRDDQPYLRDLFEKNKTNVLYAPYRYNINANRVGNERPEGIYHFVGAKKPWQGAGAVPLWTMLRKKYI